MTKKKKPKIHILIYNEWDEGSGEWSENVIASHSLRVIELYKKELEDKSEELQKKLAIIKENTGRQVDPIWKKLRPMMDQKMKRASWLALETSERTKIHRKMKALQEQLGEIHQRAYERKDELIDAMDIPYYIEDPTTTNFTIDELEIIYLDDLEVK